MVCNSIARQFLALGDGRMQPQRWGNTSVTLCDNGAPHRVHLLNCVEHLAGSEDSRDGTAPSGL
jgi:hypothetical protein